jgi:predicted  nucleic acid-binding Zn-ribbon protein
MYTHLGAGMHKARKKHSCIWCGEIIEEGTLYVRSRGIHDCNFQELKLHTECDCALNASVNGEFSINDNERPKH